MPPEKFVPTEDSLALARQVAEGAGIPFDREATRRQSITLLKQYFNDISVALPQETKGIRFEDFAEHKFDAYGELSDQGAAVYFDQQLDLFSGTVFFVNGLLTFASLANQERDQLNALYRDSLTTIQHPEKHVVHREALRPYLLEHIEVLTLANAMSMCSLAFVVCHELAHFKLGHFEQSPSPAMEFEADALGFELLKEITNHHESLPNLKIAPNKLGSPILTMEYFADATEQRAARQFLLSRSDRLNEQLASYPESNEALYLLKVLREKRPVRG